jgi:hypothetical protein
MATMFVWFKSGCKFSTVDSLVARSITPWFGALKAGCHNQLPAFKKQSVAGGLLGHRGTKGASFMRASKLPPFLGHTGLTNVKYRKAAQIPLCVFSFLLLC